LFQVQISIIEYPLAGQMFLVCYVSVCYYRTDDGILEISRKCFLSRCKKEHDFLGQLLYLYAFMNIVING